MGAKKEGGGEKKAAGEGGGDKKDAGSSVAVFKMDLHCEGCANKLKRTIKYMNGVESVKTDVDGNKVTVTGKVDPAQIKATIEKKRHRKVDIVFPHPKKGSGGGGAEKKAADEKSGGKKPSKERTVLLKGRLCCQGCISKIKKIIKNTDGVISMEVGEGKNIVTVKGTMDGKKLASHLEHELKRTVEVVDPPKKEEKKEDNGGKKREEKEDKVAERKQKDEKNPKEGGGVEGSSIHRPIVYVRANNIYVQNFIASSPRIQF